jgi:hypothetical protein
MDLINDDSEKSIKRLRGMFALDEQSAVSWDSNKRNIVAIRSPTGVDQIAKLINYATDPLTSKMFDAFGISKEGTFLSKKDAERLATSDHDYDPIKIVSGYMATLLGNSADEINAFAGKIRDDIKAGRIEGLKKVEGEKFNNGNEFTETVEANRE